MVGYGGICWYIEGYEVILWDIVLYGGYMERYCGKCRDMNGYDGIWWDMVGYGRIWWGMEEYGQSKNRE